MYEHLKVIESKREGEGLDASPINGLKQGLGALSSPPPLLIHQCRVESKEHSGKFNIKHQSAMKQGIPL